jgi:hypothetical protein
MDRRQYLLGVAASRPQFLAAVFAGVAGAYGYAGRKTTVARMRAFFRRIARSPDQAAVDGLYEAVDAACQEVVRRLSDCTMPEIR